MEFSKELELLIKSRCAIIYVHTAEEERCEDAIKEKAREIGYDTFFWDFVDGYKALGNRAKANPMQALEEVSEISRDTPMLFVIREFHDFISDPMVRRKLRNLSRELKEQRKNIIIISPILKIPQELTEDIYVLDFILPTYKEIDDTLTTLGEGKLEADIKDGLIKACQGLTMTRIRQVLRKCLALYRRVNEGSITLILEEKKQYVRQKEVLQFYPANEEIRNIGGLKLLKDWLQQKGEAFSDRAQSYGLPFPKGVLLLGIPGTGKSLCVKAIAHLWRMPLLRLDTGALFGMYVGESEARTRDAIRLSEAMAPCVLWVDELDKAFAGISGGFAGDSGTSARVFGTFITWMQEKTSPVFIAATANNKDVLPSELLRKGRFDELFFVTLPNEEEREEIFEVHIRKRGREARIREFDLKRLAKKSDRYSGAEIEQAIIDAMFMAFVEKRDFTTEHILECLSKIVPLSKTKEEEIRRLEDWARQGNARPASIAFREISKEESSLLREVKLVEEISGN
jgi:SpoVK/Ycf46/Vps4 family AAA+-type ATPase